MNHRDVDVEHGSRNRSGDSYMKQIEQALARRREKGTLRRLAYDHGSAQQREDTCSNSSGSVAPLKNGCDEIDFSSNDYLGLAQCVVQHERVQARFASLIQQEERHILGATGSRLLSGDSAYFGRLERILARLHNREAALLCNSGYDANLSVVSSLPCHVILYDEYIHNSIHMGMRLWQAATADDNSTTSHRSVRSFRHNCVEDLKRLLMMALEQQQKQQQQQQQRQSFTVMIIVESVYSMDGDLAPLQEFLDLALELNAAVVVDEAHALGVYGRKSPATTTNHSTATTATTSSDVINPQQIQGTGLLAELELEQHPALFASVHTFGKGAGCHGAVLCCNDAKIKEYWINFAYPLIYSTALPLHSLVTIRASYEIMTCPHKGAALRRQLQGNIELFRRLLLLLLHISPQPIDEGGGGVFLMPSISPIQALRVAGNQTCTDFCARLLRISNGTIRLYPIKSPTVPVGQERVRIVMHAHNTTAQVQYLVQCLVQTLQEMEILPMASVVSKL